MVLYTGILTLSQQSANFLFSEHREQCQIFFIEMTIAIEHQTLPPRRLVVPSICNFAMSGLLTVAVDSQDLDADGVTAPDLIAPASLSFTALELCLDYLAHFGEGAPYSPTAIPEPLTEPLMNILSDWERSFIATKLLEDGDIWRHSMLLAVLKAAQFLEIEPLIALCFAWCSSQIAHMCETTPKSVEAATLLRKFFGIPNDWTPEEEECLAIENEWPDDQADA